VPSRDEVRIAGAPSVDVARNIGWAVRESTADAAQVLRRFVERWIASLRFRRRFGTAAKVTAELGSRERGLAGCSYRDALRANGSPIVPRPLRSARSFPRQCCLGSGSRAVGRGSWQREDSTNHSRPLGRLRFARRNGFTNGRVLVFSKATPSKRPGGRIWKMRNWVWSCCNPLKFPKTPNGGREVGFASAARPR
jgi:hypothetical protein